MNGIQLKIVGQWIALPQDFSLSMEQSNPLFNEQGTFSFPFEVPLAPNRHVFKNLADPFGHITLRDINGLDAELWYDGIMLYRGKTETEEEIEIEDVIPLTFISGNSDFMTRIEGMNAREVPIGDAGKHYGTVFKTLKGPAALERIEYVEKELPKELSWLTSGNVGLPYPSWPYCNTRVVCQEVDKDGNISENGQKVLDAERPLSAPCFYVLYFLEMLMKHLGIVYNNENLSTMEDMNRLAFWHTQCHYEDSETVVTYGYEAMRSFFPTLKVTWRITYYIFNPAGSTEQYDQYDKMISNQHGETEFIGNTINLTSDNYPDTDVKNILEGMQNAFGIRFIYDERSNVMQAVYLKDIFRNNETLTLPAQLLGVTLTKHKSAGYRVTYGVDDDDNFRYTDFSNVKEISSYGELIQQGANKYDTTCYYDPRTGNAYRVKVDEETGEKPVLFEVGGFNDYTTGGASDEPEEISIPFTPVILNDTNYENEVSREDKPGESAEDKEKDMKQVLTPFADVELREAGEVKFDMGKGVYVRKKVDFPAPYNKSEVTAGISFELDENYDTENEEESPLRSYDAGFVIGIMRGGGSDAHVEIYESNYDNENNDWWGYVPGHDYSFTSDTIDNYGRPFDYNGTEEGGIDQSGRFSLKLIAEKPGQPISQEHKDRGLVAKFLSEYLYFMANKKTLTLTVDMSISDIIHVDFLKRYKIGEYVGFINKISYSLDMDRVRNIQVEMFML